MQDFASEAQGKLSKRVPYSIVIFLSRGADFVLRSSVAERYDSRAQEVSVEWVAQIPLEQPDETSDPVPAS